MRKAAAGIRAPRYFKGDGRTMRPPPALYKEVVMSYIYELLQAPQPADEWATEYDFSESPCAFPIASRIGMAENRDAVIARFGAWLEEHQLGLLNGEAFIIDTHAADRYFEGRFAAFQKAVSALQKLNEIQFIHDHGWVQALIDKLGDAFTSKYGDYVLWDDDVPIPFEEFLRKAQPGQCYYFGAVMFYK